MNTKKLQLYFFLGLLLAVVVLTVLLFQPFIVPLALAFVACVVVRPVHRRLLKFFKDRKTIAALATVTFVLVVILAPLALIIQQVTVESFDFYADMTADGGDSFKGLVANITEPIKALFPTLNIDVESYLKTFLGNIVHNASNIFSGTASFTLGLFIAVISLFYLLRDGHKFRTLAIEFSPLADVYDNQIIDKIEKAVNSVMMGSLFTSVLKALLAALGFAIFGVPHAILWGALTAIVALLPVIGAGITIIPAVLYLLAMGSVGPAVGLLIWGMTGVGLVDNFVMPLVIGKSFTVHPLWVLLSVVGGLIFFGPIGLFLGPLVIALLSALLEIYKLIIIDDTGKKITSV